MTSVSYSIDNGDNWVTTQNTGSGLTITTPTVAQGDKVLWKGEGSALYDSTFSSTGNFNVCGNIMSLLYGDNFVNQTTLTEVRAFLGLFWGSNNIISAENLVLPAQTLTNRCYGYMFKDCTSLTTAPELPATTLINGCYDGMFQGCTSLTTAPDLNATILVTDCYDGMFQGCTSLNYIKMLATLIQSGSSLNNWVSNVAATGTFIKAASMTTLPEGASGIPSGWTVLNELAY